MARTHFSGPLTAGSIRDTSGTTVGTNVSNRGFVVLAQKSKITQSTTPTALSIIIPANSMIISIISYAETDFTSNIDLGTQPGVANLASGVTCAAGVSLLSAETDVEAMVWQNIGDKDVQIYIQSKTAGIGAGYIVVTYAQSINAY